MRLPSLVVVVAALVLSGLAHASPATPASVGFTDPSSASPPRVGPTLEERFAPRDYVSGGRVVPVVAHKDMLSLRTNRAPHDAARIVEDAIVKLGANIRIADARRVRGDFVAVHLVDALPRGLLVALARQVEQMGHHGDVRVYPVLSRMTGRAFADEHLVVTAAPGMLDAVLRDVTAKTGGTVVRRSLVPHTALVAVGAPMAFDAVEASRRLAVGGLAGLVSAEPDLLRELALKATVLDDERFADQWHLSRQPDDGVPGLGEVFADDAWDVTLGSPDVVIAVFDSGIDVGHPDLVNKVVAGFDSVGTPSSVIVTNPDGSTQIDLDDPDYDDDPSPECTNSFDGRDVTSSCPSSAPFRESHGTSVAGVIGAEGDNGIGVTGVCPRCSILPVRLLGDDAASGLRIAEAFTHAVQQGAHVINNSWGPGFSVYFPLSEPERAAFELARTKGRNALGTVILFAAGNDTADVGSDAYASHPSVIAVAASSNMDDWAYYSNYGSQIDVAAPSQGVVDERDGYTLDDFGIVTTDVSGDDGYDAEDVNIGFGGTSAASPVTAGVVGLVLSANPALTAAQVRLVLTSTADKIVADKVPWEQFFGQDIEAVFAYDEVGHSIGFGFGRVNAARAVAAALAPGLTGASCSDPACTFCSAEGVCLDRCGAQSDCVDGSVCTSIGACEIPRDRPSQFLGPCTADCAWCTPSLDTEFGVTEICTRECANDDECPDGFDCRLTEEGGPSICGVGDKGAGNPNDFFSCFSPQIGTSVVVESEGRSLCGDICFAEGAPANSAACPFGFTCASADCRCTAPSNVGCFEFLCEADDDPQLDESDFFFPVCLPNPGHADKCSSDVDCQLGDYCSKSNASPDGVGDCELDDRDGCDICATCTSDDQCVGRGVCIGRRDDGIGECAWACGDVDACPGDSACREVEAQFGTLFVCLSPNGGSQPEDRCDPQYQCEVACRDDVACARGFSCVSGVCERDPIRDDEGPPPGCSSLTPSFAMTTSPLLLALLAMKRRRRPS